ncbi:pyruvate:ferredoxin (flavodoxin) oxidoreductase [Reinekea marinisedimentorum]|uniref:Pyruvate-flavodoxin oxidoreductase n=1 Tax=Reinekea marinisedimentorum TaxID=230495 RepID=A0A4R3I7Q4_9GAMM|nr:pyruvate:ferredoxin (flavodoxin) oxidoreductase [Reinekea marinisedimentorum]TCS42067.1 pyruvate-ferredoxin/flavodoxin oxidoreductase [Reinekea marinisedimentorum]
MNIPNPITVDGNEAVARIAHQTSDILAIYPITPASPMGEIADLYSSLQQKNLWGVIPSIVEMQSEAGAAGVLHGALQGGAISSTFTSSQGLLLMIPNLYKIAGELTPCVIHVATRSVATHALSIFCDHSDVMAARATGWGIWFSNSVQQAQDGALLCQMFSLKSRIPFIHAFDGFRTSHEISKIDGITREQAAELFPWAEAAAHRARAMQPEQPEVRGTSQNPDVFFQSRERINPIYQNSPAIFTECLAQFERVTGRSYQPFEYFGAADAQRVVIAMGSSIGAIRETVQQLNNAGEKVGMIAVHLYLPFLSEPFIEALPDTTRSIAVLDRTKEPGAQAEPLMLDISLALVKAGKANIEISHGRYGLSSKELTPAMVTALFREMSHSVLNGFTLGINDDLTNLSVDYDSAIHCQRPPGTHQSVFYGLGADGTVSANKNTIKIIGELTDQFVQGYFEYDSKKSGAVTVSHLRFSPEPIHSSYLIEPDSADFVSCHQFNLLDKYDVLNKAKHGATLLINAPFEAENVWLSLPYRTRNQIASKGCRLYAIDAYKLARELGLGRRINTIMQACYFRLSGVLPEQTALDKMKEYTTKTYQRAGTEILKANHDAIDRALERLHQIPVNCEEAEPEQRPDLQTGNTIIDQVVLRAMRGQGNLIPVSQLPLDGSYPTGTARFEKRNLTDRIPVWEPDLCTQCGKCVYVCPHAVIRSKLIAEDSASNAPASFKQQPAKSKAYGAGWLMSYQVSPEDCTGCELCVDACPITDKQNPDRKAINMADKQPLLAQEIDNWEYFLQIPAVEAHQVKTSTISGSSLVDPLFEFSGACSGCGETPYISLITRLFGNRMLIANATGCSSIYGGNLPTTPYTKNTRGEGPAWNNSLFEDNAEFALGLRLSADQNNIRARSLLSELAAQLPDQLVDSLLNNPQQTDQQLEQQRLSIIELKQLLSTIEQPEATDLGSVAQYLQKKSIWGIGGDGWAYDIGFGGLDHVLASGKNVNLLVLDTEVYSNTGGQMSKATPTGAIAKFAAGGRSRLKKDLFAHAMAYEDVYVAQVAFGAKDTQTLNAIIEAENYPGTSLIIAYSPCIAHGIDLKNNLHQQQLAVSSGHWPLLRYNPAATANGSNPLKVDYKKPIISIRDYMETEARFSLLKRTHPEAAEQLATLAQEYAWHRFNHYSALANLPAENNSSEEA